VSPSTGGTTKLPARRVGCDRQGDEGGPEFKSRRAAKSPSRVKSAFSVACQGHGAGNISGKGLLGEENENISEKKKNEGLKITNITTDMT